MPGPARPYSARGAFEFVARRMPDRVLDMAQTRSGKPVPEAQILHQKIMDTFVIEEFE